MDFDIDDVALLNVAKYPNLEFKNLTDFFDPKKLLLLGNAALPAGMLAITLNVPVVLNNISTLYSFNFDDMMDNTINKKVFGNRLNNCKRCVN